MAVQEKQGTASASTIFVETTADGTLVAHVGDHDLSFEREGSEPRVRDTDLARWLGYAQPRMVRKLIKRMIKEGKIVDVHVRSTVERTSMPQGGERETIINEFWLTRTEALLVSVQSETPQAWKLTKAIVAVFEAVLDRRADHIPAEAFTNLSNAMLKLATSVESQGALIARIVERMDRLEHRASTGPYPHGLITRERAKALLAELRSIAALWYPNTKSREWRSQRARLEKDLRKEVGLAWRRWEDLESHHDATVQLRLAAMRADALRDSSAATRRKDWAQTPMFKN